MWHADAKNAIGQPDILGWVYPHSIWNQISIGLPAARTSRSVGRRRLQQMSGSRVKQPTLMPCRRSRLSAAILRFCSGYHRRLLPRVITSIRGLRALIRSVVRIPCASCRLGRRCVRRHGQRAIAVEGVHAARHRTCRGTEVEHVLGDVTTRARVLGLRHQSWTSCGFTCDVRSSPSAGSGGR